MSDRQSDHFRTTLGPYHYRTASAEHAERQAREAENRGSFEWRSPWGGGASTSGSTADGWTVIAALLLGAAGLYVAYIILTFVFLLYLYGIVPYIYFFAMFTSHFSFQAQLTFYFFFLAQFGPFWLLFRRRTAWRVAAYCALLPPMTTAAAFLGHHALSAFCNLVSSNPASFASLVLVSLFGGLPSNFQLPFAFIRGVTGGDTRLVTYGIQVSIIGSGLAVGAFYLARKFMIYLGITGRWTARHSLQAADRTTDAMRLAFERCARTWGGRAVLLLIAIVLLAVGSSVATPLLPMPIGYQTYIVVVVGFIFGWRLATVAVIAWTILAAIGLPVLSARSLRLGFVFGPGYLLLLLPAAVAAVAGLLGRAREFGQIVTLSLLLNATLAVGLFVAIYGMQWGRMSWPHLAGVLLSGAMTACLVALGRWLVNRSLARRRRA